MKLTKVDYPVRKGGGYRITKIQAMIEEFMNSNMRVAEVVFSEDEYKDYKSCYSAWFKAIQRSKRGVRIFTTDRKVYLEKIN